MLVLGFRTKSLLERGGGEGWKKSRKIWIGLG